MSGSADAVAGDPNDALPDVSRDALTHALTHALGRVVLEDAGIDGEVLLSPAEHLALIAAGVRAEQESRAILHRAVLAARAAGVSWAAIGAELGMSRQAAQQRFGGERRADNAADEAEYRWLGPVTAFDELPELDLAGRAGWRTVEAGTLSHRMMRTDTQWEHRRILWRRSLTREHAEGWEVGCRAFPWIYLVRDLGVPPVS